MKEEINIDKLIRDKLEGFAVEPPEHLWEGIRDRMEEKRRKRRIVYFSWAAAAAVIVLACFAGWHLYNTTNIIVPDLAQKQERSEQQQLSETGEISGSETGNIAEVIASKEVQPQKNSTFDGWSRKETSVFENQKHAKPITSNNVFLKTTEVSRISHLPVNCIKASLLKGLKVSLAECRIDANNKEKFDDVLSDKDKKLIAANILKYGAKKKKKNASWIVGAGVSPGYAAHTSSYSSEYKKDANTSMSGGVKNLGGGISVQYKTGKKIRIESGIYYAQNSQSPQYSAGSDAYASCAVASPFRSGAEEQDDNSGVYANSVDIQGSVITANSNAGVIRMTNIPSEAEVATSLAKDSKATLFSSDELRQVFGFVEIPFCMRYRVWEKKKVGVDFIGGVNAGIIVSNNVYLGGKTVGTTEDISTLNVSGTLGFGVNYRLGKHFLLAMEPRFNYYLNSINTRDDITYKPYRIGVFTGFYYEF